MIAGTFADSMVLNKPMQSRKLLLESDILVQRMLLKPGEVVQPVVGTGIGIGMMRNFSSAYVPFSAGVQINVTNEIMISATGQYRLSLSGPIRSYLMYAVGISGWLPKKGRTKSDGSNKTQTTHFDLSENDRDHDGLIDANDNCPEAPGFASNGGCPEDKIKKKESFSFDDSTANILNTLAKKILFLTNSSELRTESYYPLKQILAIVKKFPELYLAIEGHTDNVGNDNNNLLLSDRRARTVMDYLIKEGVDPNHLTSIGYGESRPVTSNKTEAERAQNRRVVFTRIK